MFAQNRLRHVEQAILFKVLRYRLVLVLAYMRLVRSFRLPDGVNVTDSVAAGIRTVSP